MQEGEAGLLQTGELVGKPWELDLASVICLQVCIPQAKEYPSLPQSVVVAEGWVPARG